MSKNIFIWILLILITSGCGYTPMYSSNFKSDFNMDVIDIKGDYDLSNFIKQNIIETPRNNNVNKTFKILISSAYFKEIQTKDKSGKVTQYSLNAQVNFTIKFDDKSETISFDEKSAMNKFNDDFEESNYEKSFKENISQIFSNKLKMYLSRKK